MEFFEFREKHVKEFDKYLERYLDEEIKKIEDSLLQKHYGFVKEYVFSGGKRLRPLAMMMSFLSCKGDTIPKIMLPCVSIELLHTYSLILDDIMDEDMYRRGKPTLYMMAKKSFSGKDLVSSSQDNIFSDASSRHGTSIGILLGNLTGMLSRSAISSSQYPDLMKGAASDMLLYADGQLHQGQMLDILFEQEKHISEQAYLKMIEKKTGELFGLSFRMGSFFAGADDAVQMQYHEFGKKTAIAFQIQDDVLDLGDTKGHEKGSDIRNGKKTLMVIHAMSKAGDRQKKIFLEAFANKSAGEKLIDDAIAVLRDTGAVEHSLKVAKHNIDSSKDILSYMRIDSYHKQLLNSFSEYMLKRKT